MPDVTLVLFHRLSRHDAPPLTTLHARAREILREHHVALFRRAGVDRVVFVPGREAQEADAGEAARPAADAAYFGADAGRGGAAPGSFGETLAATVREHRVAGCIVMGDGAVPLARPSDAAALVAAARSPFPLVLTNNRYSSDVCALSDAGLLASLPPLPSDNALPRWLEEVAGIPVRELPGRQRLALDLDTPQDLALVALARGCPPPLRSLAAESRLAIPRLDEVRELARDPHRELLVMGRSSSRTLAWLERHARCRVRFLAEERGLRASSPLAMAVVSPDRAGANARVGTDSPAEANLRAGANPGAGTGSPAEANLRTDPNARHPRATIGRLIERDGPSSLVRHVGDLADGAVLDSRVLLADRLGADEEAWPSPEDRFASDLLLPDGIEDDWLRALTEAALAARIPIVLGGHTLVGPGIPLLLAPERP